MAKTVTTYYYPKFSRLPEAFNGFKIAHISDLHNKNFGGELEKKLIGIGPDIIVVTGDMIHTDGDYAHALSAACGFAKIAPTYYVNGNHESVLACYKEFADKLRSAGVKNLDNEIGYIERGESKLAIVGMSDPTFFAAPSGGVKKDAFKRKFDELSDSVPSGIFRIFLSHRPELFEFYMSRNVDVIFTGHAHGGQVRFPIFGALYAPNQGLFPRYTDGMKSVGERRMIISRGLGKSNPVPRIFNPPEIVVATLGTPENQGFRG